MILVSLQPYPFRKIFIIVAGLIVLSSISCFADSLYLSMSSRPYDQQITRIGAALSAEVQQQNRSLACANNRAEDLRGVSNGLSPEGITDQMTHVLDLPTNWPACRANQFGKRVYAFPYAYPSTAAFYAKD